MGIYRTRVSKLIVRNVPFKSSSIGLLSLMRVIMQNYRQRIISFSGKQTVIPALAVLACLHPTDLSIVQGPR